MDSTSTSTSRFRFRDHNQEIAAEESSEGHTTADSSSVSSNEDEEIELQSMTSKGVQHLCSELIELKQESDEDFQKTIFSNYTAFLAILKDIEGLQSELSGLKYQASAQKELVQNVSEGVALRVLSESATESVLEESLHVQPSSPSVLERHTENVSDILDTHLSEHRLDDALSLLEMEAEFVHDLLSGENFPSDQLMSHNSTISEKRAMLSDQLELVAKHPRVSAPELQQALSGLCQLGEDRLATQLMLRYYDSRIASGIFDLQLSKEFQGVLYIQEVAKFVCSMISQAARSFMALHGETLPYTSVITQWASKEIEIFAACFKKYVESLFDISGRLSTTVEAMQIATSYCSLLEKQRIFLLPSLTEHIRPCIEEVLRLRIDHLSKVTGIFTSTDTWVLDRYYASGILIGRSYAVVDRQPEYLFLTNSGRKFVTLFQSVAEEISPLIPLQMESVVLKGIMDLLTTYIVILESALTSDTDVIEKSGFSVNLPESPTQGVSILANLSTIMQLSYSIIKNVFEGIHHLDFEIDHHLMFIQDIYSRLKACFLDGFIPNIFSPNADHEEICITWEDDSRTRDLIPSVPYLELYLELRKLHKLGEDDCINMNWLTSLLMEAMDAAFEWLSSQSEIWSISKENLADNRTKFMQFILDAQFLVEIARCGGYLSDNVINVSRDIVSSLDASFVSAGLGTLRDSNDSEWPANVATRAVQKLQQLHAKESLENESSAATTEESLGHVQATVGDIEFKDNGVESQNEPSTLNGSDFDTNTREENPVEEVVPEEHNTLSNRQFSGEIRTTEKSPEISTTQGIV